MMATPVPAMKRTYWWLVFAMATVALSKVFQAFKVFTITPTLENGLWLAVAFLSMSLCLAVLIYDSYVKEKAKGSIEHPIRLFEWIYQRQQFKVNQGGSQSTCQKV